MPDSRSDTSERRENKGDSVDLPVSTDPSEAGITLLDALPLGILISRENGEILYSNPASQKLFAASHSELLGAQWWQGIIEQDQAAIPENRREAGDSHRPLTFLNAVAKDLIGRPREEASGQAFSRVFNVVDAETGAPSKNPAEHAMDSLQIVHMPANCLLQRRDRSELAIEDSAAPIMDADG